MDSRNLVLIVFVAATLVFASLTVGEFYQVNNLESKASSSETVSTTLCTSFCPGGSSTSSSSTFASSPGPCPVETPCSVLVYISTASVKVESVEATQQTCQSCRGANGEPYVEFAVTFENVGNSPIYIPDGSAGLASSIPANSPVLLQVAAQRCAGTYQIVKLSHGQSYTMYAPSCGDGFQYQQGVPGSLIASFEFNCTTNAAASTNPTDFPNATTVSVPFSFP
jgi:hypothetical protein